MHRIVCFFFLLMLYAVACNAPQKPIDAETRHRIDSTITAQTRLAQLEIDSFCATQRKVAMPYLVDSIKRVRQREIEEKLRAITQ